MQTSKFTVEQISGGLRRAEGVAVTEICRELGITETTFYRWKRKYHGISTPELRELRQLREGRRRLKLAVADLTLDPHGAAGGGPKSGRAARAPRGDELGAGELSAQPAPLVPDHRDRAVGDAVPLGAAGPGAAARPLHGPPSLGVCRSLLWEASRMGRHSRVSSVHRRHGMFHFARKLTFGFHPEGVTGDRTASTARPAAAEPRGDSAA